MQTKNNIRTFLLMIISIAILFSLGCKKTPEPDPVPVTVKDIDGNVYHEVTIVKQVWLVENLKTTRYRNGDAIPAETVDSLWNKRAVNSTGAFCNYNNDVNTGSTYGLLYNWFAATDIRNIAPDGWHVASQAEWQTLIDNLGGETMAGGKLKETGTSHWYSPNEGATNQTGFTALPGGYRVYSGKFEMLGAFGIFWTTTSSDEYSAMNCGLFNEAAGATIGVNRKGTGAAIRCIKN